MCNQEYPPASPACSSLIRPCTHGPAVSGLVRRFHKSDTYTEGCVYIKGRANTAYVPGYMVLDYDKRMQ